MKVILTFWGFSKQCLEPWTPFEVPFFKGNAAGLKNKSTIIEKLSNNYGIVEKPSKMIESDPKSK